MDGKFARFHEKSANKQNQQEKVKNQTQSSQDDFDSLLSPPVECVDSFSNFLFRAVSHFSVLVVWNGEFTSEAPAPYKESVLFDTKNNWKTSKFHSFI